VSHHGQSGIVPGTFFKDLPADMVQPAQAEETPATIRVSYSYRSVQEQVAPQVATQKAQASEPPRPPHPTAPPPDAPAPPVQTLKPAPYNLPWDGQPVGVPDGRDLWDELWAPAGQVRSSGPAHDNEGLQVVSQNGQLPATAPAPESKAWQVARGVEGPVSRDERPPRAVYRLHAKEQAVKSIKALRQHGWEVMLVGVGDETYAHQVHDKLWELGLVDGPSSPLMGENIVFVEHSSQVKDVAQQLGAVMGVVDHDWSTISSLEGHVDAGCRCVLLQPTSADREKFQEKLLQRERADASMSDSLTLLSSTISSLREVEEELLLYGVDMTQVLTQAHAASAEPGVHKLVSQFMEKEARVVELTKQVEEAAASTSMPVVCCPRSRTEMMMAGSRSADAWTQACEVFGTDSTVVALQDGKCVHWAKPDGVRRAPFYPLAPGWHHGKTYWNEMCDRGKPLPSASAGVGITAVCTDSGAFAIHSIEYGSPAYCSQMLREGDLLISIDGIVIKDLVTSEINRLLRGPSGSPVTVAAATPAAPGEVFYTYMTRRTVPTANKLGKGRLLCLVDKIFLEEEVAPATQLSVLRVRLRSARNLNVQRGSVFGIITLSTFSPIHEEQRHSTAPVQLSGSSASFEDETFSMDLHDPMRQRIEVQIFQQNTTRLEMSQAMGRAVLSAQDVVTATSEKRHQWWRLLSSDMNVVVGPGGAPCEVQISAEILSHAEAKARQQDAQGGLAPVEAQQQVQQSKDEARMAEALGVTLTIDDDYETMVGSTEEGMKRYSKELCLDLAAALYTSEDRFVVCGLSRGSIVVFLNIVADKDGVDLRPPKALAMLLKDQAADRNSLIRFASTTKGVRDVEISPAFNEPTVRSTARPKVAAGGPSRPLSPREHQQTPVHADDNERGGIGKVPAFGRPALALAPKDRAGVLLSGLAEGQLRAKNPALHKMPAVISLSFDDDHPASFGATTVQKIRLEAAKCIYLPASMVEVGEVDSVTRMVDVCIYPDNHLSRASGRSGEDDAKHRELAMQPGVQHVLASQLAGQVFEHSKSADHSNPMRDTEVLKHVVWAQCLKEPANLRTREVVAAMIGAEDVGAEAPVQEIADPRAEAELQAGNRGVGLTSTVPTDKKIWVSAPTLGSVWEELRDDNNIKYWISHRDSVVSKSNPSELWPLPPSWEQRVDDRRRLQYRFTSTGAWQFEHPCASAVVHGVLVLGKGACMVALRQLAKERGWVRLEEAFFASHPWGQYCNCSCYDYYYFCCYHYSYYCYC
jgi:hypothetical protein